MSGRERRKKMLMKAKKNGGGGGMFYQLLIDIALFSACGLFLSFSSEHIYGKTMPPSVQ
jgi:hypothetical protein